MNAKLESIKVQSPLVRDDEFAVEYGLCRELVAERIDHLGEVSIEGFLIPALDENLVAIPKDENAKAVPLWLVDPFTLPRHLIDALGEHGEKWRVDGKVHVQVAAVRISIQRCRCFNLHALLSDEECLLSRIREVCQTTRGSSP